MNWFTYFLFLINLNFVNIFWEELFYPIRICDDDLIYSNIVHSNLYLIRILLWYRFNLIINLQIPDRQHLFSKSYVHRIDNQHTYIPIETTSQSLLRLWIWFPPSSFLYISLHFYFIYAMIWLSFIIGSDTVNYIKFMTIFDQI